MEYSAHALAKLSGVSTRTLRWYHQKGLLLPLRVEDSGYRYYGPREVDRLQQILFFRALGVELSRIGEILDDPSFDRQEALRGHLVQLQRERVYLEELIATVEETIQTEERGEKMSDEKKFAALKQKMVDENEARYGKEVREKYGDQAADESNRKMMNLSPEEYARWQQLSEDVLDELKRAVLADADPAGVQGEKVASLHKQWLCLSWGDYRPAAHRGLGDMYVADARFTAFYDKEVPGCAQWLRDAIYAWIKE